MVSSGWELISVIDHCYPPGPRLEDPNREAGQTNTLRRAVALRMPSVTREIPAQVAC